MRALEGVAHVLGRGLAERRGLEILVGREEAGADAAQRDLVAEQHRHAVEGAAERVALVHRLDRGAIVVGCRAPRRRRRREVVDEELRQRLGVLAAARVASREGVGGQRAVGAPEQILDDVEAGGDLDRRLDRC